jgi:hypothetical protein
VRATEYRNAAFDVATYQSYRADDAVWPPVERAYGGKEQAEKRRRTAALGLAVIRLIVPVALLLVLLGATYLYADALLPLASWPVPIRNAGLAMSDLVLPGAWYCIHLVNRRYGPGYAFAQLLAGMVISLIVS